MNIEINGNSIVAEEGISILEAARRADIHIPTLCFVAGKKAETPCGLCSVEVAGIEGLVQACSATIKEGMVITIEPGLYLPGKGGVRYEDTIVITKKWYSNFYQL